MRTLVHHQTLFTLYVMFAVSVYALPQWQCLGLDTHTVNCITVDDLGNVIAGTENGMYVYFSKTWYEVSVNIATNDLLVTGPARVMAACGGEFDSSGGLYEANLTMLGPPFYSLRMVSITHYPTALAKTANSDVVYTGTAGTITYSILDTAGGGYFGFTTIPMPQFSFGVESPYCAALYVSTTEKVLYAGGYDRSPDPGPGHLLRGDNASLATFTQLNVSAIAEGVIDWGGMKLFVGTVDTGIFYRSEIMSAPLQKHSESPNNEKVNDIIVLPMAIDAGHLVAAVSGGVYSQFGTDWQELDDIPAVPKALAAKIDSTGLKYTLYAATDKGVYVFDSTNVAVKQKEKPLSRSTMKLIHTNVNNLLKINFTLIQAERITVTLFDMSGRMVAKLTDRYFSKGTHSISWSGNSRRRYCLGSGVFIARMAAGNTIYDMNVVFTK